MLLTRAPLTLCSEEHGSFDLHVLGLPPAFVLSQDQTLKLTWSILAQTHTSRLVICVTLLDLRGCLGNVHDSTERRLRIPFVRLFTMSKSAAEAILAKTGGKLPLPRRGQSPLGCGRRGSNGSKKYRQAPFWSAKKIMPNNNLGACG